METIEEMMTALGAVRVPPEDDDFEKWLDDLTEYDPATIGFDATSGVVVYYPKTRPEE